MKKQSEYDKDSKQPFQFYHPAQAERYIDFNLLDRYALDTYDALIKQGHHTQVASRFLPQTTYTAFYMMGEIEGLKNYFRLRLDSHAQEEIRLLSEGMIALLEKHQPKLYKKVKL